MVNVLTSFFTSLYYSEYFVFSKTLYWVYEWMSFPPYILSISLNFLKRKYIQLHQISFLLIYKIWKVFNWQECQKNHSQDIARKTILYIIE